MERGSSRLSYLLTDVPSFLHVATELTRDTCRVNPELVGHEFAYPPLYDVALDGDSHLERYALVVFRCQYRASAILGGAASGGKDKGMRWGVRSNGLVRRPFRLSGSDSPFLLRQGKCKLSCVKYGNQALF